MTKRHMIFLGQLILLALIFSNARFQQMGLIEWIFFAFGGTMAGWAFAEMNLKSRFHFLPRAREGSRLLTSGPYRWWRHPMYVGVGLMGLAVTLTEMTIMRTVFWIAYLMVIEVKMRVEEMDLIQKFPAYLEYQHHSSRWIPWIY